MLIVQGQGLDAGYKFLRPLYQHRALMLGTGSGPWGFIRTPKRVILRTIQDCVLSPDSHNPHRTVKETLKGNLCTSGAPAEARDAAGKSVLNPRRAEAEAL